MKRKMCMLLCWRKKAKGKAPLPPGESKCSENVSSFDSSDTFHFNMDQKENIDRDIELTVVLPGDRTASTIVNGSKPMIDLLIFLCGQYHLNPSAYTIDLISADRSQIKFKPNTPIGMLEVEKVILKSKIPDDKNKKIGPTVPEQTVRVVINYKQTQKTVMRVSPQVPLQDLLPSICDKCEFDPLYTVLLKDHQSQKPLDLTKSLSDLGLRELYAMDHSRATTPTDMKPPPLQESCQNLEIKPHDEKGFFNFFRRSKKKRDQTSSAPSTPMLGKARPTPVVRANTVSKSYDSNTLPSDVPKKRRAPLPPMHPPQSVSNNITRGQARTSSCVVKSVSAEENEKVPPGIDRFRTGSLQLGGSSSLNSSLRRTKRKAPLPPSPPPKTSLECNDENSNEIGLVSEEIVHVKSPTEENSQDVKHQTVIVDIIMEQNLEEIEEKEEVSFSQNEEHEDSKTEDMSTSSVSTDVILDTSTSSVSTDVILDTTEDSISCSGLANGQQNKEDEIIINNDKSFHLKTDDNPSNGNTILDIENKDPIENGISTQTTELEHDNQIFETKVIKKETEIQVLPNNHQNENKNIDFRDNVQLLQNETKETLEQTGTGKGRTQDSAVQTVNFYSDVEINPVKELVRSQDSVLNGTNCEVNGQSIHQPQINNHQDELSRKDLGKQELDEAIKEIPCSKGNVHTQTVVDNEETVESLLNSPSKSYQSYRQNSEPKPKPSNEITRDYLPKIGMTTYKIVPQRSFEVEKMVETESPQDMQHLDVLPLNEHKIQSPVVSPSKGTSPILSAREAFFSELSSVVKNGNRSPQYKPNGSLSPTSPVSTNNTEQSRKEILSLSSSTSAPIIKTGKSSIPEFKAKPSTAGLVKAPSSFYLQIQRRASSMYVTSAIAKTKSSSSSSINNNNPVKNIGKDTSQLTIKTAPSGMDVVQLPSKPDEKQSEEKSLITEGFSVARNGEFGHISQVSNKSFPSQTEGVQMHSELDGKQSEDRSTLDKHLDAKNSELGSISQVKITTIPSQIDVVQLLSREEEKRAESKKPFVERHSVAKNGDPEPPCEIQTVVENKCILSQPVFPDHSKPDHSKDRGASYMDTYEKHLVDVQPKEDTKNEVCLMTAVEKVSDILQTESSNVIPVTAKLSDTVHPESNHNEASLTSSSKTVRSLSSPTGQSVPLSLQKLRTFATPRPFLSTNPSSASTVTSAVKRSQSFTSSTSPVRQPLKTTGWSSVASPTESEIKNDTSLFSHISQEPSHDQILTPELKYRVHSPPPVLEKKTTVSFESSDPELIHQSLLTAIRSGEAAANLKRVTVRSNTISINGGSRISHPGFSETQHEL
ncbi:cordon-bleu protein-like 1 isoform 2-T2 [Rhinophrynus dorsalis]